MLFPISWFFTAIACSSFSLNCDSYFDTQSRENCYTDKIMSQYKEKPKDALKLVDEVLTPTTRDFVLMELTREYHPQSRHLCVKMVDQLLQERCLMMVSRPHLQRKKMKE